MSDLSVEQKVFLVKSFNERQKSFAAAIKVCHTKYGKHINVFHRTLRSLIQKKIQLTLI